MRRFSREAPDESAEAVVPRRGRPALRPLPTTIWLVGILIPIFAGTRDELSQAIGDSSSARAVNGAAVFAFLVNLGAHSVEALYYVAAWRAMQRRVGFLWMYFAVVSLAACDVLGATLARTADADNAAWLAPFAGLRVLPGWLDGDPALRVAVGGIGLLALLRVFLTIYAQRQEGATWRGATALTIGAWLAGRLAIWWTTDLVRGMSPMG